MDDRSLALRVRRGQLLAKLDEWDAAHPNASDVDRHRSRERRELQRLLGDVDSFVASVEAGTAGAASARRDAMCEMCLCRGTAGRALRRSCEARRVCHA